MKQNQLVKLKDRIKKINPITIQDQQLKILTIGLIDLTQQVVSVKSNKHLTK